LILKFLSLSGKLFSVFLVAPLSILVDLELGSHILIVQLHMLNMMCLPG
jgi:hypothetical protein